MTAPRSEERRQQAHRDQLLPNEAAAMRRPHRDDVRVWISIYVELLEGCRRFMEAAPPETRESIQLEAERIGRRIDYWRGVATRLGISLN